MTTTEILDQFNLVVFGDLSGTSEVEGRSLIGGNLTGGSMTFNTRAAPISTFDELIVGGNVSGGGFKNLNNGGDATVGGNVQNMNLNGNGTLNLGGAVTGTVHAGTVNANQAVTIPDFQAALQKTSADLAGLAGVAPGLSGNRGLFNTAIPDGNDLAVYNVDTSFFDAINEIELGLNGATTVVINVTGTGALTISDNFLGGPFALADNILWNFSDVTSLTFGTQFFGSVLAPNAAVTNTSPIEGSLIADSLVLNGEVHQQPFAGDLPTTRVLGPGTLVLFGGGLLALGAVGRRRHGR
ncbi:choice-of-anchor A family protein [Rhodovibrio salinarum]|nr:choice-of-anchor A family protein [Rhodovibrio salinarum]